MKLYNHTYLWINIDGTPWMNYVPQIHICSSILCIRFMEFHNYTRSPMNNHGVPRLIIFMGSIDNNGTPLPFTFCPVGTPYALNTRTGLILAECISLNLYDTKLFVWAKYRIMRPWFFIRSLNVTLCWCITRLKALSTNEFGWCFCDYTQWWQAAMPRHWSPLLLCPQTGYPR